MNATRIEGEPQTLERFAGAARRGFFADAFGMLNGSTHYTIEEPTVVELQVPQLLDELRLFARCYESQLGRTILLANRVETLPNVHTNARAAYQLNPHDHFEQYGQSRHTLERFNVRASLRDVSVELARWARERASTTGLAERIAKHFNLTTKEH